MNKPTEEEKRKALEFILENMDDHARAGFEVMGHIPFDQDQVVELIAKCMKSRIEQ